MWCPLTSKISCSYLQWLRFYETVNMLNWNLRYCRHSITSDFALNFIIIALHKNGSGLLILFPRRLVFTMDVVLKDDKLWGDYHTIKMLCRQFLKIFVTIQCFVLYFFTLHDYTCFMYAIRKRNVYDCKCKPILSLYTDWFITISLTRLAIPCLEIRMKSLLPRFCNLRYLK